MSEFVNTITANPLFGVTISAFAYIFGVFVNRKLKTPFANPILIADILIIAFLLVFKIPYENYSQGGSFIELFLAPATAALAVKIHQQIKELKENWLPLLVGTAVGSLASILCVLTLCHAFNLEETVTISLFPKSVTTAIAVPICQSYGGIPSVTVMALVFTGIFGAVFSPMLIKIFRINNSVAAGTAIGTASHALGTTKALEIGDVEGAMSGIAIGMAGLITTIYSILIL